MDERKLIILNTIIKEHIKTGTPVGSGAIADKYNLNISPATVRNEMVGLENEGFIIQPHTSAGRVPTEKAYRLYIEKIKEKKIKNEDAELFEELLKNKDENNFKLAAKEIARISNNAVFWAFHRHNLYYTGVSNLLSQPEFAQNNLIYDISSIIDRFDEIVDRIFNDIKFDVSVFLGADNPFSEICGSVLVKYKFENNIGVIGILGPMRMNYEKNITLVNYISKQFK